MKGMVCQSPQKDHESQKKKGAAKDKEREKHEKKQKT